MATLVDHIDINDIASAHHSSIIITDVADHWNIAHHQKEKKERKQRHQTSIIKKKCSQVNIQIFKDNLDVRFINGIECSNSAYNKFIKL